jgi:hypothetical protein
LVWGPVEDGCPRRRPEGLGALRDSPCIPEVPVGDTKIDSDMALFADVSCRLPVKFRVVVGATASRTRRHQ